MKKRTKVVFATIAVAGYMGSNKVTNTLNWRVFLIDEKDPDGLTFLLPGGTQYKASPCGYAVMAPKPLVRLDSR